MMFKKRKEEKPYEGMSLEELLGELERIKKMEKQDFVADYLKMDAIFNIGRILQEGNKEAGRILREFLDSTDRENRLWAFWVLLETKYAGKKLEGEILLELAEFIRNPINSDTVSFVEDNLRTLRNSAKLEEFAKKSPANAKLVKRWRKAWRKVFKKKSYKSREEVRKEFKKNPANVKLQEELSKKLKEM